MSTQPGSPGDFPTRELTQAFLCLMDEEECRRFLTDLCTPEELRSLSERWRVAQLLDRDLPYRKIQQMTGVSTATITRVARSLTYGEKGYMTILERTRQNKKSKIKKEIEKR